MHKSSKRKPDKAARAHTAGPTCPAQTNLEQKAYTDPIGLPPFCQNSRQKQKPQA